MAYQMAMPAWREEGKLRRLPHGFSVGPTRNDPSLEQNVFYFFLDPALFLFRGTYSLGGYLKCENGREQGTVAERQSRGLAGLRSPHRPRTSVIYLAKPPSHADQRRRSALVPC